MKVILFSFKASNFYQLFTDHYDAMNHQKKYEIPKYTDENGARCILLKCQEYIVRLLIYL